MSAHTEERGWRAQRSSNYQNRSGQRPNPARERSANNSPNPSAGQNSTSVGGNNAWGNSNRENRGRPPMSPMEEEHVPVNGFNARDAREMLKRGYFDSMNAAYKSAGKDAASTKSGGPWGSKPNTMAGGQDFLLQLRKQLASLQQGGPVAGG
ncbi:hypothetical protein L228DRAFT_60128 [Xylona heveae TC161]|uniref:Uncharacterized protein n=1 Tax=Xylona heveae (strain CBS 132557 / TC161) TaxID=1328760 RepID=A0A165IK86_XYLHT|nr:hypothetical protein L228DRAFT_60128 [Xylona heveae TC161]KZF25013.1 hypothetical protein L228DRAFT_60128 [Xylona heveae TC161]